MDNAYIYTRVSTIIQVDGFSLDAQEEEIRAYAKMHNINIVGKYSDEGKSGKNAEHRPAFNQMMKRAIISYIEIYKDKRPDGHWIKKIHFSFPVTYDGEAGAVFIRSNNNQDETVAFLSRA